MSVQQTYKTKFSPSTEDLLDSSIMPYSCQWWYILKKYGLIQSNVCIKPKYETGIIWITVVCKWHSKFTACINQYHSSLHYVLIYCLLKSLQFIIIKVLQTKNCSLKTYHTMLPMEVNTISLTYAMDLAYVILSSWCWNKNEKCFCKDFYLSNDIFTVFQKCREPKLTVIITIILTLINPIHSPKCSHSTYTTSDAKMPSESV